MNAVALDIVAEDPILESSFCKEMVRQMRVVNAYDTWPATRILAPFALTPEKKREIPLLGNLDAPTLTRITAFYTAIAVLIEQECGLMATPVLNLTQEGFGRVLITVGKLVVMDRTLRDAHRFGFPSLSKMKDEADKLLSVALEIIGVHPKAAGL